MTKESRELKAEDITEFLNGRDDFNLEIFASRTLELAGWNSSHGGSYTDPTLGKRRLFDVRGRHRVKVNPSTHCDVSMAVECKSLSPDFPLIVSRVPRPHQEASQDVIRVDHTSQTQGRHVSMRQADPSSRVCLYGPGELVGKSLTRIGWDQGGKRLISSETELFDKWSQALASAAELVDLAHAQTTPNSLVFSFIIPALLVNDDALWVVDYTDSGRASPQRADEAYYFADVEHALRSPQSLKYQMSHLHIYTRKGFEAMLKDYASASGLMFERTFGSALRQG